MLLDDVAGLLGCRPGLSAAMLDRRSRRLAQDRRHLEPAALGRGGRGQHLVTIEARAATSSRSTFTSG